MIIGLMGHQRAGKDTVGLIIKYLTAKYSIEDIIDIFKNPLPDYKLLPFSDESSWQIKKFAYAVKQVCSILTGIPVEDFEKEEVKNSYLGEEWEQDIIGVDISKLSEDVSHYSMKYLAKIGSRISNVVRPTVRELLQKVGTDAMRDVIHPDCWVNTLMKDYRIEVLDINKGAIYPNWIITDVRFENEAKTIKDRNGIIIKVVRFNNEVSTDTHESETALDNYIPDYVIDNSSTIEELIDKVKIMLTRFDLL